MSLLADLHVHMYNETSHKKPRLYLNTVHIRKTAHQSRHKCGLKEMDEKKKQEKSHQTFSHQKLRTN